MVLACGAPAAPVEAPPEPVAAEPTPATARQLVELLVAHVERGASIEAHVDAPFGERLPSGDDLATMLRAPGCDVRLEEGPGYGLIAIPPPMVDDPPEDVARIEAIIAELSASTEIFAQCGDEILWAIAVRRGEDGALRALAWRDLRNEDPMQH